MNIDKNRNFFSFLPEIRHLINFVSLMFFLLFHRLQKIPSIHSKYNISMSKSETIKKQKGNKATGFISIYEPTDVDCLSSVSIIWPGFFNISPLNCFVTFLRTSFNESNSFSFNHWMIGSKLQGILLRKIETEKQYKN